MTPRQPVTTPTATKGGYDLTPRARELLRYIRERDTCPTFSEMCRAITAGRGSITKMLNQLEERGYIRRLRNRERAILPVDPTPPGIPFLGPVPAPWSYPFQHRTVAEVWADEAREAA